MTFLVECEPFLDSAGTMRVTLKGTFQLDVCVAFGATQENRKLPCARSVAPIYGI